MHSSAALSAFCVLLAATFTNAQAPQCYSGLFTIIARGTYEPQGGSVLEPIATAINAAIPNSYSDEVVYPANSSFWPSVPVGVANAQQQMQDYYQACPDGKMVIMGYSQGAYVMAVTLAGGNPSGSEDFAPIASDIAANVAAVIMFGNPSRVLGQGTEADYSTCSVSSPLNLTGSAETAMSYYANRTQDWCNSGDPICCQTGTDGEEHLEYWSTATTDSVVSFVQAAFGNSSTSSSSTSSSTASSTSLASSVASSISSSVAASSSSVASSISSIASSAGAAQSSMISSQSSTLAAAATSDLAAATKAASSKSSAVSAEAATATSAATSSTASAASTSGALSRSVYSTVSTGLALCSAVVFMLIVS